MKRTLYTVLLVVSAVIATSHYKQAQHEAELQITPEQVEWLNKRLSLEAHIRDLEKRLANLKARYNAIPAGESSLTPWSNPSDIRTYLAEVEQDPRFKKSCKCEKVNEDTRIFCRDWQRAKSDQARWYALAKLSVEINAVSHSLTEARIEAGQMGDNIPAEQAKKQLMTLMRRA